MRFAPALRFFRRNSPTVHEQDPADLGTAFGMEASLEDGDDYRASISEVELESQRSRAALESPLAWLSAKRN
ncbi:hypothetical protein [Paucibacter sp. DJ2R-2]|uniref:hypothetical protein n=1 Tax=Paucibacter sp. DJ2R-2 TaxID=2893558 RepID=UPI0021E4A8F1|nr:hypothetical protein [Paucibacter sp. DJ2R-2]MCV2421307.1 hypothetical protein [Paucibacter sp. DJ4R-1]MCV2441238.1 hypothetical protein [Paucibacter sp. DJ2R-2]